MRIKSHVRRETEKNCLISVSGSPCVHNIDFHGIEIICEFIFAPIKCLISLTKRSICIEFTLPNGLGWLAFWPDEPILI